MTTSRPPLPARWEYHLTVALLSALLLALQQWSQRRTPSEPPDLDPAVLVWLRQRRSADAEHPWRAQIATERQALNAATGFWMAWRSHRLERAARSA